MSSLAIDKAGPTRKVRYGSMSRDRTWALRWSYFFLTLFAIFALVPPIYMLITSLKSSAEISAATNPWWVHHPTLANYIELLTSPQYLTYFRNSALVSVVVVAVTMLISIPAAYRETVVLRFQEGLSLEEIATVIGAPVGTVKSRLTRGREALRQRLAPYVREVGNELGLTAPEDRKSRSQVAGGGRRAEVMR